MSMETLSRKRCANSSVLNTIFILTVLPSSTHPAASLSFTLIERKRYCVFCST